MIIVQEGKDMTRTEYIIDDDFLDDETKMSAESQGYLWELIRCKDCKHRPIGGHEYNHTLIFPDERCPCNCFDDNWYSWMPNDNWFCGNGERKDNGNR